METDLTSEKTSKSCKNCGAELVYLPGSDSILCNYCGHKEIIEIDNLNIKELDLNYYLKKVGSKSYSQEITMISCEKCGANQHIEENYKSLHCVYCTTPLVLENTQKEEWIVPGAIIPFQIDKNESSRIFSGWIKKLWFAPNKIKKASLDLKNTKGLYLPYWTFDAQLFASYKGQRGEYYYVNVPYTTTENGRTVRRTKRERRTHWYYANGEINSFIDDTLIKATYQQKNKIPIKVSNWKLNDLKPFKNDYLKGFVTEKYTIPLKNGHLESVQEAKYIARRLAKQDIGGDTQKIDAIDIKLSEETFKHILLPVYINSYTYKNKVYNFYINGQTGSISGKRPYSVWKITLLVLVIAIIVLIIIMKNN